MKQLVAKPFLLASIFGTKIGPNVTQHRESEKSDPTQSDLWTDLTRVHL